MIEQGVAPVRLARCVRPYPDAAPPCRAPMPHDLATDPTNTHRLRPLVNRPAGTLVVHEIYRSVQGESTFAGLPCVFVRLTACHLRCGYCDTPHAFQQGETFSVDEVLARAL